MNHRTFVVAVVLACISLQAEAQGRLVYDPRNTAQAIKQVEAWRKQYQQMVTQINALQAQLKSMTGNRGMANLQPLVASQLPPDWKQAVTQLSSLAQQIKEEQAVLTPEQAAHLSPDMKAFLAQQQDTSAANKAIAEAAYKSAAAKHARLQGFIERLATTVDPKEAMDLTNRIGIEQASLQQDHNEMLAAANVAAAEERNQQLRKDQMRAGSFGTKVPRADISLP